MILIVAIGTVAIASSLLIHRVIRSRLKLKGGVGNFARTDGLYIGHYYASSLNQHDACTIIIFYFLPHYEVCMLEFTGTTKVELEVYRKAVWHMDSFNSRGDHSIIGRFRITGHQVRLDFDHEVFEGVLTRDGFSLDVPSTDVSTDDSAKREGTKANFMFIPA